MIDTIIDVIIDTLIDSAKLVPFLFVTFLIIELLEHKFSKKTKELVSKSGNVGPILGGFLGIFPQCGFSVMATNLYITRIITLGTLISIYLSTSDEMLPILLSRNTDINIIVKILLIKVIIGVICGIVIDFILRKKNKSKKTNYEICEEEHCHCKDGILKSTLKHTINTLLFVMLVSFILNNLFAFVGEDYLSHVFLKNSLFGPFITSLIGLIPNCGSSIIITELYLSDAISFGSAMSGLLTGSGVALLVLFKYNKSLKENLTILGIVYFIGSFSGVIIELIRMLI